MDQRLFPQSPLNYTSRGMEGFETCKLKKDKEIEEEWVRSSTCILDQYEIAETICYPPTHNDNKNKQNR